MPDGNSGVNPSLLGDFDLFSASAYQAELDYLSFPFMDSFLAESAGDLTFALSSAMDSQPSYSSGSSSPPGSSSPRTPATPHQQSFQPFSGHDQRAWSVNNTDSSSDPGSPSSLFTENIFSPSFIPKPPRNQYFPSDERSDNGEGDGEILVRLLDLQARISKLVKHLNGGRGSAIDCEEVLNAGKSLISLLDSVGAPSRFFSKQQQGYFFSNGLRHQAQQPLDGNNAHLHAMAQMVQKLKHTLQRCMGRLGQGSSGSNGALGAKKKKKQNPNVHLDVESCCNAGDDDLLMSLSKPALLEMGWGEEELWQGMNW
ncbi:hypothetical protein NEUTE2DRAFT_104537 [Neurospora tetrasperma FGSC 2509]|nr:hypothetical protein NEUTE2DRAFT_104537 [Neurospora tetrasperma FGSC 2509]